MLPACNWRWTAFEAKSRKFVRTGDRYSSLAYAKSTTLTFDGWTRRTALTGGGLKFESADRFFQKRQRAADPLRLPHEFLRRGFLGIFLERGESRFELVRLLADLGRAATDSRHQILELHLHHFQRGHQAVGLLTDYRDIDRQIAVGDFFHIIRGHARFPAEQMQYLSIEQEEQRNGDRSAENETRERNTESDPFTLGAHLGNRIGRDNGQSPFREG